jgi:uncharacterized protein (TIGR02118 family)
MTKILRCGYFEGTVDELARPALDRYVDEQVVPLLARLPKIRAVRVLRARDVEDGAPHYYMTFEMLYDSKEDIDAALKSPVRAAIRDKLAHVMTTLQGARLLHINHEVVDVPVAWAMPEASLRTSA